MIRNAVLSLAMCKILVNVTEYNPETQENKPLDVKLEISQKEYNKMKEGEYIRFTVDQHKRRDTVLGAVKKKLGCENDEI